MKKIGIDARFYSPNATGVGRHVYEVVQNLATLDTKNKYIIFLNEKNFKDFIPPAKNFKAEITTAAHYGFAEQTTFLKQLNQYNFDLMVFPQFNVPLFYKKKFIVTIHDLTIHLFPGKKSNAIKHFLYKKIMQHSSEKSAKILAVSENTKQDIIRELKIDKNKISVVYNGISSGFKKEDSAEKLKKFRKKYNLPENYFLYTGVLRTHKNILGLVKAFKIFREKLTPSKSLREVATQFLIKGDLNSKNMHLVIAGPKDDLYYPEIKKLSETLGIADFVHFTGFFPEKDFSKLFCASTAFVFPSFYEGFGIPPLEAMSVDVPVICSNTSSLPEVCNDAVLYFDPKNISEMAEKMAEILNPKTQEKFIKKGQIQWKKFTWKEVGEKYFKAIKENV